MVIESSWAKELMNTSVELQKNKEGEVGNSGMEHRTSAASGASTADLNSVWNQPKTYQIPLNPVPALVIMLLGIMMSSHHQDSMVSTMMVSANGIIF